MLQIRVRESFAIEQVTEIHTAQIKQSAATQVLTAHEVQAVADCSEDRCQGGLEWLWRSLVDCVCVFFNGDILSCCNVI